MKLPAVRRTDPLTISQTTNVQLLQWLHGKQHLQDNLHAYTLFARTEDRKNEWIQVGLRIRSFGKFLFLCDPLENADPDLILWKIQILLRPFGKCGS